jgi:hypothetical protein
MAQDARITKERLMAIEGVQVRATDADAMNADQGLIGLQGGRFTAGASEVTGLLQNNLMHVRCSPPTVGSPRTAVRGLGAPESFHAVTSSLAMRD